MEATSTGTNILGIRILTFLTLLVGCESVDQVKKDAESAHKSYLHSATILIKPISLDSAKALRTYNLDMSDSITILLKRLGLDWKNPPTYSSSLFEGMVQKQFSSLESAVVFQIYNYRTSIDTVIVYGDKKAIEVLHSDPQWKLYLTISGNSVVEIFLKSPKAI